MARAAPGDLDSSFGLGGKLTLNFGGGDRVSHVAITPDGRIVAVGFTDAIGSGDYAVARFSSNGTPDTSFNSTGKVALGTQPGVSDVGGGVAVLPTEQVVVTGSGRSSVDFVTERLNANGSVDGSFAAGAGASVVDFGGNDNANDMVRQPDGKFVIVGSTDVSGLDFAVARLNADGTPVTSFSGDGKLTMDFGGVDAAHAVAPGPDGKIVVAGTGADGSMAVTRLNATAPLIPRLRLRRQGRPWSLSGAGAMWQTPLPCNPTAGSCCWHDIQRWLRRLRGRAPQFGRFAGHVIQR